MLAIWVIGRIYWIIGLDEVLDLGAIGIYEVIRLLSRNGDAIASAK